jgi:protein tyrosine phosphatase (PTP) superfamily phosphohydrolase (DUF442 family)
LHNLFRVSERIYSGSSPDDETGFASLAKLGIKTIASVDGAKPDVTTAARHGLEYVHLPIGYDGIPRDRALELAKLVTARPGPFYVHCHHGLHRGPVAVAVMKLCDGSGWNAEMAELWLQQAGTSPQYPGLMHVPRTVMPPTDDELSRVPNEFPAIGTVNDLATLMVNVDERWSRLKLAKAAGWTVPKGHPDIDPPHEAVQLVEHYREAARLDVTTKRGSELKQLFADAEMAARKLETELQAKPINVETTSAAFSKAAAQCAGCHHQYRDRPSSP